MLKKDLLEFLDRNFTDYHLKVNFSPDKWHPYRKHYVTVRHPKFRKSLFHIQAGSLGKLHHKLVRHCLSRGVELSYNVP